ncbi:MAG: plasmid maintenance protein CcdB [Gammaproteobacteria bacterium]|nr:plasmid maintenance protein CcdB [Gammaproteobacteria bacterium]
MPQFSVYRNQDKRSKNAYPYFVDVQNSLLSDLNTRLVIPFAKPAALNKTEVERLCPVVPIQGKDYVLLTNQLTSVPAAILSKEVASIEGFRYEILDAIDMLITGI